MVGAADNRTQHRRPAPSRSGQAAIEFLVAIVSMLTLAAFIIQFVYFIKPDNSAKTDARKDAGQKAMRQTPPNSSPDFIGDWEAGNDGKAYTVDDESTGSSAEGQVSSEIVERAARDGAGWSQIARSPSDQLTQMRNIGNPCRYFGLVEGIGHDQWDITIPAFRSLMYDTASIEINYHIWMTASEGFYNDQ